MQWLAGLGAEAHHQRAEVIRGSSPPRAVSVPLVRADGEERDLAPGLDAT